MINKADRISHYNKQKNLITKSVSIYAYQTEYFIRIDECLCYEYK